MKTYHNRVVRWALMLCACVVALGALALTAIPSFADGGEFSATLLGANEVPVLGDLDGSGSAELNFKNGQRTICFEIEVENVAPITAAHIHRGAAGVAGPVVVDFQVAANGLSGCVAVDRALARTIRDNPGDYYVNVHNADFPRGALRGQITK